MKRLRTAAQIGTICLVILVPLANKKGFTFITGTLYSLAVGPVWITDPLIGVQTVLTTARLDAVLLLSLLIPVFLAFALGRVFCGWMCPQNTISEWADRVAAKLGITRLFRPQPRALPRTIVLAAVLTATPLVGFPLASLLSAPGLISAQAGKYVVEGVVGLEAGLIGLIVVVEFFLVRRAWCNYLCPVGGFLGLFRLKGTLKVVFAEDAEHVCGKCRACVDACGLGLDPLGGNLYPLCHNCGDCVGVCEALKERGKPLSFRF